MCHPHNPEGERHWIHRELQLIDNEPPLIQHRNVESALIQGRYNVVFLFLPPSFTSSTRFKSRLICRRLYTGDDKKVTGKVL